MMSFLSAQQALKAEAKEGRLVEENTEARSPKGEGEDFCCILCGFKESSVDKLKDHINMHFIGHVKKRKAENESNTSAGETDSNHTAGTDNSTDQHQVKKVK